MTQDRAQALLIRDHWRDVFLARVDAAGQVVSVAECSRKEVVQKAKHLTHSRLDFPSRLRTGRQDKKEILALIFFARA